MVSSQSQKSSLTAAAPAHGPDPCPAKTFLPTGPPDAASSENVEYDFSDLFSSTPTGLCALHPDGPASFAESNNEDVYDDPVVITRRSHSLVGPTLLVSRSLRLSKLSLEKGAGPSQLVSCISSDDKEKSLGRLSDEEFDDDDAAAQSEGVGLDDFEILKLVGQGAFGKVFQVRKRGTSEIYAMKVMRKDKILEKNHAEYMISEKEILTKVDHPFIVQLRYSFQVTQFLSVFLPLKKNTSRRAVDICEILT
jgi:ribosomal protein S6 kinase beta